MKNLMRISWLLLCFFSAIFSMRITAHENNLIEQEMDVEVVYFFSYACPTCRLLSPYISTWERVFPDAKRVPAFSGAGTGDHWRNAARRYFILHALNREKVIRLSRGDIDRIGFSIQDEVSKPNIETARDVSIFLSSWGLKVTDEQLEGAWVLSDMYMQDAELMLSRTKRELGRIATPIIRVSSPLGVEYVTIDSESEDPPMDFLERASNIVKKHKKSALQSGVK